MTFCISRYGWRRDMPRRGRRVLDLALNDDQPIDLRPKCPPVYDQGQLGSCTANAAGALEFVMMREALPAFTPSRLFIYYNERVIEDTVDYDSGATIDEGVRTLATQGAPPEAVWPYDISKFAVRPPPGDYTLALKDLALQHNLVVQSVGGIYGCLALGYPVMFGFTVYESFESQQVAQTGVVPMPGPDEAVVGGHAVLAVGALPSEERFIIRNSWGADWGMAGYCTMPYAYLTDPDLASDFQMIRLVGAKAP